MTGPNDSVIPDPHYFWQDLWAARRIRRADPTRHVDVGSRLDGFVAHLLSFRPVEFVDVRPLGVDIPGLTARTGDARALPYADEELESLSSLHVVEHIGLGRYGDELDPEGHLRALREFVRVLAPGGRLYLSTPSGEEQTVGDLHRVLKPRTLLRAVEPLRLVRFAFVDDGGRFWDPAPTELADGAAYGCGMMELVKP